MSLVVPLEIEWATADGQFLEAPGESEIVSAHGALLRVKTSQPLGPELRLRNRRTGALAWCSVVGDHGEKGGFVRVAVALSTPDEAFWGDGVPPPQAQSDAKTK